MLGFNYKIFIEFECYFLSGICPVYFLILISQALLFLLCFSFVARVSIQHTMYFTWVFCSICLLHRFSRFLPVSFCVVFLTSKRNLVCDENPPLLSFDSKSGVDNVPVMNCVSWIHTDVTSSKAPTLLTLPIFIRRDLACGTSTLYCPTDLNWSHCRWQERARCCLGYLVSQLANMEHSFHHILLLEIKSITDVFSSILGPHSRDIFRMSNSFTNIAKLLSRQLENSKAGNGRYL